MLRIRNPEYRTMRFILVSFALVFLTRTFTKASNRDTIPQDETMYGLSQDDLTQLYELWLQHESLETEKSFRAFLSWMKVYDDSTNHRLDGEREDFCLLSCWTRRIEDFVNRSQAPISNAQRSEKNEWSEVESENDGTMKRDGFASSSNPFSIYCPPNFGYSVDDFPKCYSVITTILGWDEAQAACGKLHPRAHLAVINNPLEAQIVSEILQKYTGSVCSNSVIGPDGTRHSYSASWIGNQLETIGDCISPFVWKPNRDTQLPIAYSNWRITEPNCSFGKESCAAILLYNMQWNDFICSWPMCAVCEVVTYTRFK